MIRGLFCRLHIDLFVMIGIALGIQLHTPRIVDGLLETAANFHHFIFYTKYDFFL